MDERETIKRINKLENAYITSAKTSQMMIELIESLALAQSGILTQIAELKVEIEELGRISLKAN